jgi:hypothetical protein
MIVIGPPCIWTWWSATSRKRWRAEAVGARAEAEIRTAAWGRIAALADPSGHGTCLVEFRGRGYYEIAEPVD